MTSTHQTVSIAGVDIVVGSRDMIKEDFNETIDSNFFDDDYDTAAATGFCVWEGCWILIDLCRGEFGESIRGKRVLELGSGTGLAGLAAAACGAHVLMTDVRAVVEDMLIPNTVLTANAIAKNINAKNANAINSNAINATASSADDKNANATVSSEIDIRDEESTTPTSPDPTTTSSTTSTIDMETRDMETATATETNTPEARTKTKTETGTKPKTKAETPTITATTALATALTATTITPPPETQTTPHQHTNTPHQHNTTHQHNNTTHQHTTEIHARPWAGATAIGKGTAMSTTLNWRIPVKEQITATINPFDAEVIIAAECIWLIELLDPFVASVIDLLSGEHNPKALICFRDRAKPDSTTFVHFSEVVKRFEQADCKVRKTSEFAVRYEDRHKAASKPDSPVVVYEVTLTE